MRTVVIEARDIVPFNIILQKVISTLGTSTEVHIHVNETGDGGVQFAVDRYISPPIGTTRRREGSGNPYANVSDDGAEGLSNEDRIRLLETAVQSLQRVVSRAEGLLGVSLRDGAHSAS